MNGRGFFIAARSNLVLLGLILLTALIYLPGLAGPFLFDDPPNLVQPISDWLNGITGWREIVFGNHSGPLGRPISMLSFLANASVSGLDVLPYKVTNLAIHLLCGWAIFALFSRLLARDPQLQTHANKAALMITASWLLHPMQVSTVLYVVQRMAQLSTFFILIALLAYVQARTLLESRKTSRGLLWLFLGVPLATATAMLCKENGALVPLLCATIELGYFRSGTGMPRPGSVKAFFAAFLVFPAIAVLSWLTFQPGRLMDAYTGRTFTLGERLLSEPRVLFDYIGALLVPRGSALGIYTDDFVVSHGLFDPGTTAIAIAGLLTLIAVAFFARNRSVALSTGILFYLAGHAMESTVFPLELYFEHRNYLPSAGLFLAIVGAGNWFLSSIKRRTKMESSQSMIRFAAFGVCAVLAFSTFARASAWRYWPVLAEQGIQQHPESLRAHLDYASMLMADGQFDGAEAVFENLATADDPLSRHVGAVDVVFVQCYRDSRVKPDAAARMDTIKGSKLQLGEALAFEKLGDLLRKGPCEGLDRIALGRTVRDMVDAAPQPENLTQKWRSRFVAARLFAEEGQFDEAINQAAKAWMSGSADPAVGVYLANLYFAAGDQPSARIMANEVEMRTKAWDRRNISQIKDLKSRLGLHAQSSEK